MHPPRLLVKLFVPLLAVWAISCKSDTPTPPLKTNGGVVFWNDQPAVPDVTVTLTGRGSGRITSNFQAPPPCGASGAADFANLPNGTYAYSATAAGYPPVSGTVEVSSGKCQSTLVRFSLVTTPTPSTGTVTFWFDYSSAPVMAGNWPMNVTMDGTSRTTSTFFTVAPVCGNTSAATFTNLKPGAYAVTASGAGNNFSTNINVAAGQCQVLGFRMAVTQIPSTVVFWTDRNLGTVAVTVQGATSTANTITRSYPTAPACGAAGTATFSYGVGANSFVLNPYTATGGGRTWSGTFLGIPGQCANVQLQ